MRIKKQADRQANKGIVSVSLILLFTAIVLLPMVSVSSIIATASARPQGCATSFWQCYYNCLLDDFACHHTCAIEWEMCCEALPQYCAE